MTKKKSPGHASPAGGCPRIFYFPALEVGQVLQEAFPLPFPLGRWSAMPFRRTLGRLSLTSRPERVARGTLGGVPLPFPRGTRSGVLPPFHGLIIAPAGAFVKTFFHFFFFLFLEGWGLVAPADGGYPPPLLPQCGIEGGETRQPVLPHTGFTGPQASEEVPMEPDVFNFHGSDLLCFTVVIILRATGFVKLFF